MPAYLVTAPRPYKTVFADRTENIGSLSIPEVTLNYFGKAYVAPAEVTDSPLLVIPEQGGERWREDRAELEAWLSGDAEQPSLQVLFDCLVSLGVVAPGEYTVQL